MRHFFDANQRPPKDAISPTCSAGQCDFRAGLGGDGSRRLASILKLSMAQPSKAGTIFLTLFALPFLGGGFFFLYALLVSPQNMKNTDPMVKPQIYCAVGQTDAARRCCFMEPVVCRQRGRKNGGVRTPRMVASPRRRIGHGFLSVGVH